jgi:hypothetical protein
MLYTNQLLLLNNIINIEFIHIHIYYIKSQWLLLNCYLISNILYKLLLTINIYKYIQAMLISNSSMFANFKQVSQVLYGYVLFTNRI